MDITQYYTQVLFLFAHLQVKITGTDDMFRDVLVPQMSPLPEVEVSMRSSIL